MIERYPRTLEIVMTVAPARPLRILIPASSNASPPSARDGQREFTRHGVESVEQGNSESKTALDIVDVWGLHSFPASDPPSNW